jgi:murein L,D-transpeptidase YcbB/YkuD
MDAQASKKVMAHRVLSGILVAVAVIGWSMFGHAVSSKTSSERELKVQIADVWNDRARVVEERDRLRRQVSELQHTQTSPAGSEPARMDPASAAKPAVSDQGLPPAVPEDGTLATGAVLSPQDVKASIKTAQAVLTELGFGPLKPDGVMGTQTRRAIKVFERRNGIPETGQLGPQTVQALKSAVQAAGRPAAAGSAPSIVAGR